MCDFCLIHENPVKHIGLQCLEYDSMERGYRMPRILLGRSRMTKCHPVLPFIRRGGEDSVWNPEHGGLN